MMRWMREQKRDDDLEDEPGGRRKIIQAHAMTTMVETRGGRAAHVRSTPTCVAVRSVEPWPRGDWWQPTARA